MIEAVATEGVHAARGARELVGLAVQCGLTLALVYVTLWVWFRLRRHNRGELAVRGIGPESSNAIAGDGPTPEAAPRGRSVAPRATSLAPHNRPLPSQKDVNPPLSKFLKSGIKSGYVWVLVMIRSLLKSNLKVGTFGDFTCTPKYSILNLYTYMKVLAPASV